MKSQKYKIKLSASERKKLEKYIRSEKQTTQSKIRAKVLLCLDENGEKPLTAEQTAQKCKMHQENVYKIRKQYATEGVDRVVSRKKRETPPVPPKVTGDAEAHIIATACSKAPEGILKWTMQKIANKIILDGIIDNISDETVRLVLKKHNISLI